MVESYKYLYLLQFKEAPLIKIGEGTKGSSNYDRIKSHLRTYGSVFDLDNSYEVIAPKKYSISALERQLKDITASFIPDEQTFLKYQGKDGATEIRREESLVKILELIKYQQEFVDIKINKGITLVNKTKPNEIKPIKPIKQQVVKETLRFPFEYLDQKHLMELILRNFYVPNLDLVKGWQYEVKRDYDLNLYLDTNKSFAKKIFYREDDFKMSKINFRDLVWCKSLKSNVKVKWIHHNLLSGKSEERSGITSLRVNIGSIEETYGERCILDFTFNKSKDLECSEDLVEWKKWFEREFIEPLKKYIPNNQTDKIEAECDEICDN